MMTIDKKLVKKKIHGNDISIIRAAPKLSEVDMGLFDAQNCPNALNGRDDEIRIKDIFLNISFA